MDYSTSASTWSTSAAPAYHPVASTSTLPYDQPRSAAYGGQVGGEYGQHHDPYGQQGGGRASNDGWYSQDRAPQHFVAPPPHHAPAGYDAPHPQTPPRIRRASSNASAYATPTSAPPPTYASTPTILDIPPYAAPSMSYSHTTPSPTKSFQQPTAEEVSEVRSPFFAQSMSKATAVTHRLHLFQFFRDMSSLLGPGAMEALSPTSPIGPSSLSAISSPPIIPLPALASQPQQAPTYNLSGVLLSEEEYRLYARSPAGAASPRFRSTTSFLPPSNGYQRATYQQQPQTYDHGSQRPRSAPPTPSSESTASFATSSLYNDPPPRPRRDSLSTIPRSMPSVVAGSYAYTPQPSYQQSYAQPTTSSFYASPAYYAPPLPQPTAQPISPTPVSRTYQSRMSTTPALDSPSSRRISASSSSTTSSSPSTRHKRKKSSGQIAFINYSACDAKTLLNGVAPSGNMKKRSRGDGQDEGMEREGKMRRAGSVQ